jgi:hypothetical protein
MEWHGDYVRQKPGPKTSLLIKFFFQFECYLFTRHCKSLFNKEAEPSVTVVLEWKSPLNGNSDLENDKNGMNKIREP